MKREELLKVFPSVSETEIEALPKELVVCWYPSSGNHFDAALDWQRQNTKLTPNLFIYSDTLDFDIPSDAIVFFSKIVEGSDLKLKIIKEIIEEEKNSLDGTFLEGLDHILLDYPVPKEPDYFIGFVHITLLKFKENWFFLVNSENEYLYLSLLEQQINIDCLYLNRPCDSFISDRGPDANQIHFIDIKKIGVNILISGKNNGIRFPLSEEYQLISEFEMNNKPYNNDVGVIYSRIG
jgi:hypothetical protein